MSSELKFVCDTNCLNDLLSDPIGLKLLQNCNLLISLTQFEECDLKTQEKLKKLLAIKIEKINAEDRDFSAKLLKAIFGKKDVARAYLDNPDNPRIPHIGECEGAALAKRFSYNVIMSEKRNTAIIKRVLSRYEIKVFHPIDVGKKIFIDILHDEKSYRKFIEFVEKKFHIKEK